jgi:DcmR-like sensory protein
MWAWPTHDYRVGVAHSRLVHEAVLYHDREEVVAAAGTFVKAAVAADEPVLVVMPRPALDLVRAAVPVGAGVSFLDMAVVGRNPNRILPDVLEPFVAGHHPQPVHVFGEPAFAGRRAAEMAWCVRFEAMLSITYEHTRLRMLCAYDASALAPGVLGYAERTHAVVLDSDGRRDSRGYADPLTMLALLNQPLPEPVRVEATLAFGSHQVRAAQQLVGSQATRARLAAARTEDLCSAVGAVARAMLHGKSASTGLILLWTDDGGLVCELRGPGDPVDMMAGRVAPLPDSAWARALGSANARCDLVQTHTSPAGTVTRLHQYR